MLHCAQNFLVVVELAYQIVAVVGDLVRLAYVDEAIMDFVVMAWLVTLPVLETFVNVATFAVDAVTFAEIIAEKVFDIEG